MSAEVILAAIGQAFFATGVGMAMMLAYGSYMRRDASLVRPALLVSGSILLVSLLATMMIFPLVFRFHMDPAGGPALVFEVLPAAFALMPGGRLIGTVFFVLLIFAALTPSLACFEPVVAWLQGRGLRRDLRGGERRGRDVARRYRLAVYLSTCSRTGTRSSVCRSFAGKTLFEVIDFIASNVLLPVGALLTCVFIGWRLDRMTFTAELAGQTRLAGACRALLRYVCPVAIAAVLIAALWQHRN